MTETQDAVLSSSTTPQPPIPHGLRIPLGSIVVPGDRLGGIRSMQPGIGTYARGGFILASVTGKVELQSMVVNIKSNNDKDSNDTPSVLKTQQPQIQQQQSHRLDAGLKINLPVLQVIGNKPIASQNQVLRIGHVVLGRVSRITLTQAFVEIFAFRRGTLEGPSEEDPTTAAVAVAGKNMHVDADYAAGDKTTTSTTLGDNNNDCWSYLRYTADGLIRREDIRPGATEQLPVQDCFLPGDWALAKILSLGDLRRYFLSTIDSELGVVYARSAVSGHPLQVVRWNEMECPITGTKEPRKCAKPTNSSNMVGAP